MKGIMKSLVPVWILEYRQVKILRKTNPDMAKKEIEVWKYFRKNKFQDTVSREIALFFKRNTFSMFPYNFINKYNDNNTVVYKDDLSKMHYVLYKNKRLYFPTNWDKNKIKGIYTALLREQDIDSPHRYETSDFFVNYGDVLLDIGAAEGIFSLANIDKASKVYMFECDENWIQALYRTFDPWKEKVVIINKYVSDSTRDEYITIDDFLNEHKGEQGGYFIKADIEGAETALLRGSPGTLANSNLQIVLCTYHRENDARELDVILKENGFETHFSKGHMLFTADNQLQAPFLRKCLIRAKKHT
jgi:hypothetical protein